MSPQEGSLLNSLFFLRHRRLSTEGQFLYSHLFVCKSQQFHLLQAYYRKCLKFPITRSQQRLDLFQLLPPNYKRTWWVQSVDSPSGIMASHCSLHKSPLTPVVFSAVASPKRPNSITQNSCTLCKSRMSLWTGMEPTVCRKKSCSRVLPRIALNDGRRRSSLPKRKGCEGWRREMYLLRVSCDWSWRLAIAGTSSRPGASIRNRHTIFLK